MCKTAKSKHVIVLNGTHFKEWGLEVTESVPAEIVDYLHVDGMSLTKILFYMANTHLGHNILVLVAEHDGNAETGVAPPGTPGA